MSDSISVRRVPRFLVRLFFGLLLVLGSIIFTDYGISWDEPVDHRNGLVTLRYISDLVAPQWAAQQPMLQGLPPFELNTDNDHGVLFEIPLALVHVLRPGMEAGDFYQLRHYCIFLVSLSGLWALYRLAALRFQDEWLGLLTAVLFLASPRLFAESFYNGKDLVFLALFTGGMYTLARMLERPTIRRALLHGLLTAATIDVRVLGLMLVPITLFLLLLSAFSGSGSASRHQLKWSIPCYLGMTVVATIVGWPYLWADPFGHFVLAWQHMSHYPWLGKVVYWGELIPAAELPWHYAPVWIILTTPITYLVAAGIGLIAVGRQLVISRLAHLRTFTGQLDVLFAGWLLGPVVLVIVLHSVLYDGWRHLYFIYPALLLLAVRGGLALVRTSQQVARWRTLVRAAGVVAMLELLLTVGRMVRMHPFEHVYFSYLSPAQAERLFERDYWGLAHFQGLQWLLQHQPTGTIAVDAAHVPMLTNNLMLLSAAERARVVVAPSEEGQYFITGYRRQPEPYPSDLGEEILAIRADGARILSIFRRRQGPQPLPYNKW